MDGTSIAFDNVTRSERFNSKSESKQQLYSPLSDDEDDEQTVYSQMFTFTGIYITVIT